VIRWGHRRWWAAGAALTLVVVASAGWWIERGLRPCGSLDRRLDRSGCVAVYRVPRLAAAEPLNWPGMVFTPDGRRVAIAGIDVQRTGGHDEPKQPPPQRAALVSIDAADGRVVQRVAVGAYRPGLIGSAGVSWSGRFAAGVFAEPGSSGMAPSQQTGGNDEADAVSPGRVRLWRLDGQSGGWQSPVTQLSTSNASQVQFSSDDLVLKAGARWWDVRTGRPMSARQANRHPWLRGWGARTVLSPDGALKVGWDEAGRVTLADAASGRAIRRLSPGVDSRRVIGPWFHFSASGRRLAMLATQGGRDGTWLRVWQVGSGKPIFTLTWSRLGTRSAWSPDERQLAVSYNGKSLRDGDGIALFRLP
jgi:hypothetical protein